MIRIIGRGKYKLIETHAGTKVLVFDTGNTFTWIHADHIGEILLNSHKIYGDDCILASGVFRLYQVTKEQNLTDQLHLELSAGDGIWQGYLLPTGLTGDTKERNMIIPTHELITVGKYKYDHLNLN